MNSTDNKAVPEEKKEETQGMAEDEKITTPEAVPETAGQEPETPKEPAKEDKKAAKKAEKEKKQDKKPEKKSEPTEADKVKEANDKYLRLMAEYDNFRKRSQKEREALYGDTKADIVTAFLPVYDNLVRALEQSTEDEAYRRGVEMIMTQFDQTLQKLGVTEIDSLGVKFDPNLHNAVMHTDDPEKGDNEIVEVFKKGFRLGDKIIRFAMVKVAN